MSKLLQDISRRTARTRYDLERMHDGVHVWVGGDMSAVSTAAYDFIFYLHHAYIDLVWEMFRRNQVRRCRINPETDYPRDASGSHGPDNPMVAFTWLRNTDGLANYWTQNWYGYADPPSCPRCCPRCRFPRPIFCNRRRRVCVSRSRRVFPRRQAVGAPGAPPDSLMDARIPQALEADISRDAAAEANLVPRFRGRLFEGPPSDGRTRFTALEDAFRASADMQGGDGIATGRLDTAAAGTGDQLFDTQGSQAASLVLEGQGSQTGSQTGTQRIGGPI